ncbi:LysR family transcriptional regulator [Rhodococcus pyridinivorans]|nr:LysR family transcriptional regulator [Rhodococcus pyridinivorans]
MQPQLDLRLLSYFVAVAEELHFGRAAARLHIAQPSLSVQIRKLEQNLGAVLLLRSSRHVELTPAGQILLDESRRLLANAERAVNLTREAAHGVSTRKLVIGFQGNAAAELTPHILSTFQSLHPGIQVQMHSYDFSDPYVGLADGSSDVAFVRPPLLMQDWLGMEALFVEPRVMVVSANHPLAQLPEVSVEQVTNEFFVARKAPRTGETTGWPQNRAKANRCGSAQTSPPSTNASKRSSPSAAWHSHKPRRNASTADRAWHSCR